MFFFWGPYHKDYSIFGSILGSAHIWKLLNTHQSCGPRLLVLSCDRVP